MEGKKMTIYFKPSETSVGISGESHYQKAIKEIIFYDHMVEKDDLEYKDEKLTATLILEDDNKYDLGNAVRVDIDSQPVGYLKVGDARHYRKELTRLNLTQETCTCKAAVYGKREDYGRKMNFGVWLSIDPS